MKWSFAFVFLLVSAVAQAQPYCDSLFTLRKDKNSGNHSVWIMHTPLKLGNYAQDSSTINLRLQKMRNASDKWIIRIVAEDMMQRCVKQDDLIYFKFENESEPGFPNETAGNCEGIYQLDIPIHSIGAALSTSKLKKLLRNKRLVNIGLENVKGYTDGYLTEEQSDILRDIINCMLEE